MAKSTKMWVAFRGNTTIAAGVMGEDEVPAQAGVPIHVPYAYGKHVTDDKFADKCDAPKKKEASKPKKPTKAEIDAADKKLSDAKDAVVAAEKKVAGVAGKGEELETTAAQELTEAQAAFNALEDPDAE